MALEKRVYLLCISILKEAIYLVTEKLNKAKTVPADNYCEAIHYK